MFKKMILNTTFYFYLNSKDSRDLKCPGYAKDKTYLKNKSIIRTQLAAFNALVIFALLFHKAFNIISYYGYW